MIKCYTWKVSIYSSSSIDYFEHLFKEVSYLKLTTDLFVWWNPNSETGAHP